MSSTITCPTWCRSSHPSDPAHFGTFAAEHNWRIEIWHYPDKQGRGLFRELFVDFDPRKNEMSIEVARELARKLSEAADTLEALK